MSTITVELCGGPLDGRRREVDFEVDVVTFSVDVELKNGEEGVLIDTYESRCESIPGDEDAPVLLFRHSKRQFRRVVDYCKE